MKNSQLLNWPNFLDRTDPEKRESTNKFSAGIRQTRRELKNEMNLMGVEEWRVDDITGSGGDPGVVLRWIDDGIDYAVACDTYTSKGANMRSIYKWVQETRKRADRPVKTGQDDFAAAQLPSGDDEPIEMDEPPHRVLGVPKGADKEEVISAFRKIAKRHHADTSGPTDTKKVDRAIKAKEEMLDG